MCYQTQMSFIFVILFSGIGQCFCPARKNNLKDQKSGYTRIIQNEKHFLVNIPGLDTSWFRLSIYSKTPQINLFIKLKPQKTPKSSYFNQISGI